MYLVECSHLISERNVSSESNFMKTSYSTLREFFKQGASFSPSTKGRIYFMTSKAPFSSEIPFCCFLSFNSLS